MNKFELDFLINHVEVSLDRSDKNESKLTKEILNLDGMSGIKTRHFYNNLCSLENCNYLEVGVWKGSSFISAIYGNKITPIAIENWSEFNGNSKLFLNNVKKLTNNQEFFYVEKDCFKIENQDIKQYFDYIDIFLYDGAHDFESQKKAITYFKEYFANFVIIVIDDWREEWKKVIDGTYEGLKEAGLIIHKHYYRTSKQEQNGNSNYWNGVGIFICEKK
jgi:hypothetical protein